MFDSKRHQSIFKFNLLLLATHKFSNYLMEKMPVKCCLIYNSWGNRLARCYLNFSGIHKNGTFKSFRGLQTLMKR